MAADRPTKSALSDGSHNSAIWAAKLTISYDFGFFKRIIIKTYDDIGIID
jgi:hypothetical protein